jgi:transcriptional regulator with XRE-family HTH domain
MKGMSLGKQIKRARIALGISQQAVANKFSITRAAVAQWEADSTRPDQNKLLGLAALLKTSIGDLLEDGFELHDAARGAKNYARTPDVPAELNAAWSMLLPEEQAGLLADIQRRAAHNLAVMQMHTGKAATEEAPGQAAAPDVSKRTVSAPERRLSDHQIPFADRRGKNANQ